MATTNLPDEEARLAALRRYAILDTPPEEAFDRVARLAASLFHASVALISFFDADRQWFKSRIGFDLEQVPREGSLCAETMRNQAVTWLGDASKDPRFSKSPLVLGGPRVRFYAGAPLLSRDGYLLGTICVLDGKPCRGFRIEQQRRLATLAGVVMNELELRHELGRRAAVERDLKVANELMSAIAEAPGVRRAMEAALKIVCDAVGASSARAWALGVRGASCQLVAAHGPDGPKQPEEINRGRTSPLTLTNSWVGDVLTSGTRRIIHDLTSVDTERYPLAPEAVRRGYVSGIVVPVEQDGRIFAINLMFSRALDDMEGEADRIEALVRKIRPILGRKLAEERITLLESVVLNANDGVIITEADGSLGEGRDGQRILFVNPAFTRITGYSFDDVRGRSPSVLWGWSADAGAIAGVSRALAEGRQSEFELLHRRKDGSEFWGDISTVPIGDEPGQALRCVAILRDTSERRRLQEALVERETTFRLLFESNPIPMWVCDLVSRGFLEVNRSAVDQYGFSRERFLAMTLDEISPEDTGPILGRLGVRTHRKADGTFILADVVSHVLEFGGRRAALIAAIDVTEQKRSEEGIRHAKEVAEAASQAKSELLANMSHELRTPLNAIIGFSEIMQVGLFGPLGSPRYDAYVNDIRDSAGHLLTVISDILDIAKIEANSFRLDESPFDPA
ncbi:MAG: PAS domain S-box protein, partial [Acidobacteriota bacterium]